MLAVTSLRRVLVLIAALGIAALGTLAGVISIVLGIVGEQADSLVMATFGMSVLVLALSFGLAVAWHAWQAIQNRPSALFRPRMVGLLVLTFMLAVLAGQTVLSLNLLPTILFPPFHAAAAILPAVIILALVGRRLGGITSWREVVLATASGAFLSTALAFSLEALILAGLVTATLASVAIRPGGLEMLQTVGTYMQDPARLQALAATPAAFLSPALVTAVLAIVAGLIPVLEESVKTVGVGLMAYRKLTLSRAFLWGLACGAGFAMVEGLLNTASGLEAWAPVIVLRVGATLLHCTTGALMGLAWYMVLAERRWDYGIGLFIASVSIHSLWNALGIGMALLSLQTLDSASPSSSPMLAGLSAMGILSLMITLVLLIALALAALTWQVRERRSASDLPPDDGFLVVDEKPKASTAYRVE